MKKLLLAGLALMSLGIGIASAQEVTGNAYNHLPSPAYTYSVAGG